MKVFLLVVALAVIPACSQENDVAVLQHEAVTLAKYYQPKLGRLDKRIETIFQRGSKIPGNLPGIQDVGRRLQEARDVLAKLHGIVGESGAQTSPLEKEANDAAKEGKLGKLQQLVAEREEMLASGVTIVNDDLDAVESWIGQYDRGMLAMAAPAPVQPTEPPPSEPTPAQTEPVNTAQPATPPSAQEPAPQH